MTLEIELRCIRFPLIILEMFLQLDRSPPGVNSIDWTGFGKAHTLVYIKGLTVDSACQSKNTRSVVSGKQPVTQRQQNKGDDRGLQETAEGALPYPHRRVSSGEGGKL